MSPTISACMIVKDEEDNLAACLDSFRAHVDEIIVVDTGSSDRTREVAAQRGAIVHQFDHRNHPEAFFMDAEEECAKFGAPGAYSNEWALGDFAAARNESFRHATKDFVVWVDADDVLDGAASFRKLVQDMHDRGRGMGFLAYNYATDHLGRVFYRQWRERVFRRGAAVWHGPVHEVLMPVGAVGPPERYETPVYQHRRKADRKGIAHRNYKILLRQAWQWKRDKPNEPMDPRILFYLGQEARFVEPNKAVGFYEEYLQRSGWAEERAAAHVAIGSMLEYGILGLGADQAYAQADREFAVAAAEMPDNPDGLLGLARIAYHRRRWADCIRYTEAALKIGNTDSMLGANPMDRLYRPHFFYNYALAQVGRLEDAARSCEEGLKVCPDDPGIPGGASGMLALNLTNYRAAIDQRERQKAPPTAPGEKLLATIGKNEDLDAPPAPVPTDVQVIWSVQLWKQIRATGDVAKMRAFLESLPAPVVADPVVQRMFDKTRPGAAPASAAGGLDVVFYLGAGPEPWDPRTPDAKGLGGSETAAIEMAKNLTKLGHRCVVYAEASGTFDGVEYRHHSAFKGCSADVFVASRAPWAVEHFGQVDAGLKLLWVHDTNWGPTNPDLERFFYKFDRILCLSRWHKDHVLSVYPTIHPDQIVVTRNGIDPARFAGEKLRGALPGLAQYALPAKTNSMVFSSSPNRGLDMLLYNFSNHIRRAVPDAQLHVFYGFDTWETIARQRGNQEELAVIARFKELLPPLGQERDGVYNHGKRPQREVAAAYMRAKVWPYLTAFTETSCITAMEAMAAGAVPVCSALAALPETVAGYGVLFDNADPQTPQRWVETVVKLLTNEPARASIAAGGMAHARANLSWEGVAREWSEMFDRLAAEVARSPMQMWRSA